MWCGVLSYDYGGIEDVPVIGLSPIINRDSQLQNLEEGRMKIALCRKASECTLPGIIQLRTPATGYARRDGVTWVMDNGCFSNFDEAAFLRMANVAISDPDCLWFAMPDVVGSHTDTIHNFNVYVHKIGKQWIPRPDFSKKAAFVIQDGCNKNDIPWARIRAVFLGGTTKFKMSREAWVILEEAKKRGKWVHVGRVNTPPRIAYFHGLADSIDGSGMAKYDHMLDEAMDTIERLQGTTQTRLDI